MSKYESRIGDQLHQGGLTPGQSDSIALWLRGRFGSLAQEVRELGPGSLAAKSSRFLNNFIAAEQRPFRSPGQQEGVDGVGGGSGSGQTAEVDGGLPPTLGGIPDSSSGPTYINQDNSLGFDPVDLRPIFARLSHLEQKVAALDYAVTANTSKIKSLTSMIDDLNGRVAGAERNADKARRIALDVKAQIDAAVECP